jgi:dipeptidase E
MSTILLTSAGMQVKDVILRILLKPPRKMKLAHIVTAANVEGYKGYVDDDRRLMEQVGFQIADLDLVGKNRIELQALLGDKDIIYVQGGNTFYLLHHVRESNFDEVVKRLIDRGIIYIGVSAGSIIAGQTIETSVWRGVDRNVVDLTDLTGLGLVPFNIFVHYSPQYKELILREQPKSKRPLRILTDDQALLIQDGNVELVGKTPAIIID